MYRFSIALVVLILCMIVFAPSVYAAKNIDSQVDRNEVGKGEPLILTVTVDDPEAEPEVIEDNDFSLAGQSVFTSTEIINFNMKVKKTFKFTLIPRREGSLMTPEVNVSIGNDILHAPRHRIEVSEKYASTRPFGQSRGGTFGEADDEDDDEDGLGSLFKEMQKMRDAVRNAEKRGLYPFSSKPIDPEIFMRASLGTENAYVNQQILLNMDVYIPEGYSTDIRFIPSVNEGIMVQKIEPDRDIPYEENGTYYIIKRIAVAIYPMKAGNYRMKPFRVNWFSNFSGTHTLETDEFDLHVKELPQPAPIDFCGGVGVFDFKAECSTASAMVSKPFSVDFIVSGKGNASSVTIEVPDSDGADRFDTSESIDRVISGDILRETKKASVSYVPMSKGKVKVPSIKASFFNPETGKYYSKSTSEILINAVGGESSSSQLIEPNDKIPSDLDITFSIKSNMSEGCGKGLISNPIAIFISLIPLIILIVLAIVSRISGNIKIKESSGKFLSDLKKELKKAEKSDDVSKIHDSFFSYLSLKLSLDKGISTKTMLSILEEKARKDIAEGVGEIFKLCDQARFASGSVDISKISSSCLEMASELDKILKKGK